ncbi:MAG: hypothetical protein AAF902_22600 [Chloroflexota bacterium]
MKLKNLLKPSLTDPMSLQEVVAKLQAQEDIDAILFAGSTGKETLKSYSDYDLLIILNEMASPPSLLITTIDGILSELYFLQASAADDILQHPRKVEANTLHGAFVSMIARGKIAYDASGRLKRLRTAAPQTQIDQVLDHQIYSAWYSVTYNHAQNLRYYHSEDQLYLTALQCRLLYCISNCLSAYFTLRGLPWRGEKDAIRYLQQNDPAYLELFQMTVSAGPVEKQFPIYEKLVEQTLVDGWPKWPSQYTVLQPHYDLSEEKIAAMHRVWNRWVA